MNKTKLWTAMVTPMRQDGRIDFDDLGKLADRQAQAGNGILLIGSTGEGLALSLEEKKSVVEHVAGMGLTVPLMVGVGGFNIEDQKSWIRYCNELAIDAFLLVAPLYSKPGPVGMSGWFTALMDQSEKPCMIYNIPGRTGVKITPAIFSLIKDHPNFWSVKEAGGSIQDFQLIRETLPSADLFSGDDSLLPYFSVNGCDGLVSVASNVWPEATGLYLKKCMEGETESLFPLWRNASAVLFSASNPIPAKRLLVEKGWIKSPVLRMPLTTEDLASSDELVKIDKEITRWYESNR